MKANPLMPIFETLESKTEGFEDGGSNNVKGIAHILM